MLSKMERVYFHEFKRKCTKSTEEKSKTCFAESVLPGTLGRGFKRSINRHINAV